MTQQVSSIMDVTVSSARSAVRLYFEPLTQLSRWIANCISPPRVIRGTLSELTASRATHGGDSGEVSRAGREDREAKDALQRAYGDQAGIQQVWGRLDEAMKLLKKQEAICLKLGNKSPLGFCYWIWGLLARARKERETARKKLEAALEIFTELNMPQQRYAVRAELEKPDIVAPEELHRLIATAAYFRAERRGFIPGAELEDWLEAEAEIDNQIKQRQRASRGRMQGEAAKE